jgi:hypothetical protein
MIDLQMAVKPIHVKSYWKDSNYSRGIITYKKLNSTSQ